MTVALLSELREPPVVGRFYMVPAVWWSLYSETTRWWPVLGPLHTDVDVFPTFPWAHYHLDARFLNARHESTFGRDLLTAVGATVVHDNPSWERKVPRGVPVLRRMKCRRSTYGYGYHHTPEAQSIKDKYGEPRAPIRRGDGRLLCPHRKADLSSFPPDENGIVVCPLHGLRVQCAMRASPEGPGLQARSAKPIARGDARSAAGAITNHSQGEAGLAQQAPLTFP